MIITKKLGFKDMYQFQKDVLIVLLSFLLLYLFVEKV